jgi:hypothetical protein
MRCEICRRSPAIRIVARGKAGCGASIYPVCGGCEQAAIERAEAEQLAVFGDCG